MFTITMLKPRLMTNTFTLSKERQAPQFPYLMEDIITTLKVTQQLAEEFHIQNPSSNIPS
ncbi:hypothetical protein JCM10914A_47050 [Paenibacillus sp. JCM 10914]